jgi:hypothetical protein
MSDLNKKTCKELREIAKQYGVVGRWDMNKQQLIDALENVNDFNDNEITFENDCIIKEEDEIKPEGSQKVTKDTIDYLNNAEPGTLVAFKRNSKNVAMSGKLVTIENGKVFVESKNGTLFKLNIENIIWVKTGERWPKWVFNLFNSSNKSDKGVVDDNAIS